MLSWNQVFHGMERCHYLPATGGYGIFTRSLMIWGMGRRRLSKVRPAMSGDCCVLPGTLVLRGMGRRP